MTVGTGHPGQACRRRWLRSVALGSTVDDAVFMALDGMFRLLGALYGLSTQDAVALSSVAVDLRVTQIVNQTLGAHAVLPPGAIR